MIPASFDYVVADSVDHAVSLLAEHDDAKVLAGGHSLLPLMKLRLAAPATLVDISRIVDLKGASMDGDHLVVGALTRHHDVVNDPLVQEHCGVLSAAARQIGDVQIRHCGTLGGAIAHADPAGDLPAVVLALDAELIARGPDGERAIPAADFFQGYFESALAEGEILTHVWIPSTAGAGGAYYKFAQRDHDWAIVAAAAVVRADNGTIGDARIGLTNMGAVPIRASAVEAALAGASADSLAEAVAAAAEGTDPPDDTFATADYRRSMAPVAVRRAVEAALAS